MSRRVLFLAALFALVSSIGAHAGCRLQASSIPISLGEGKSTTATWMSPKDLAPGEKVPVLLVFGGFESADEVLSLLHPDVCVGLASFNYPFSAPRQLRFPESLRALPEAKALYRQTVRG